MDWRSLSVRWAPALTIFLGVSTIVALFIANRARRKARTASFGYVRERSGLIARRMLVLGVALMIAVAASGGLWRVTVWRPELLPQPAPTSTPTLIPTPTPRTPTPTFTPTATPTITPTATPPPISAGGQPPLPLSTPFPAQAVTPGPEARVVEVVLAAGRDGDLPVAPARRFPAGTGRVYAFFTFAGMSRNVPWVHVWYKEVDGEMVEVWSQIELWGFDSPTGHTWRYLNCRPGSYELRVYIGRGIAANVPFLIEE
jgi:hypothetical protein